LGEAAWSLLYEVKRDLRRAIVCRESEIKLIHRLWEISPGTPREESVLKNYGPSDLSDRYDLLAILYHDVGDLDKAIAVLRESKNLCEFHGIRFDGQDLLGAYLAEKEQLHPQGNSRVKRPKARRHLASARLRPARRMTTSIHR
jgi:hypothetical protein